MKDISSYQKYSFYCQRDSELLQAIEATLINDVVGDFRSLLNLFLSKI